MAQVMFVKLDYMDQFPKTEIRLCNRLQTTVALADIWKGKASIKLNKRFWIYIQNDKSLQKEIIAHEVSHIVSWIKHDRDISPHGPEWSRLMQHLGYQPRTKYSIPMNPMDSLVAECGCGYQYISRHNMKRLRQGRKLVCKMCANHITPYDGSL